MRERRKWYREHNCCTECGKQDAYTIGGRCRCYECNEKKRINEGYSPEVDSLFFSKPKQDRKDYSTIPREQYIERGMCYICGQPVKEGYRVCEKHYQHLADLRQMQKENGQNEAYKRWIDYECRLQHLRKAKKEYKNMGKIGRAHV